MNNVKLDHWEIFLLGKIKISLFTYSLLFAQALKDSASTHESSVYTFRSLFLLGCLSHLAEIRKVKMQLANPENNRLVELLKVSETANQSFNYLIDCIYDSLEKCTLTKHFNIIEEDKDYSLLKAKQSLERMILASGDDPRVIKIAQIILSNSGISSREIKILDNGKVITRKIYFVQRSDGAIKIGSSLDVQKRLSDIAALVGDLKLLGVIDGTIRIEKSLHKKFINDHIHNEWFSQENINRFINDLGIKNAN
ncbi:Hypothetical P19 (fragment) [Avibacterium paragallinarum JF4211]|uniref:Bacteriophage T5 Orf172 DNA-binding domain-containing protein n=3 Tax=Avibacterium paragallinarum TaxID=728 RepID=A0A377IUI5_AVIPA